MRKVSIIILGLIVVAGVVTFRLQRPVQEASEKAAVVVSTAYPVEFLVTYLAGDGLESQLLVPVGTEPHDFEPTFQDAVAMRDADLLLTVGGGFDEWADGAVAERSEKLTIVAVDALPGDRVIEGDPHFWLDPTLYAELIDPVTEALVVLAPESAEDMRSRAEILKGELDRIHEGYMTLSYSSCYKEFVVLHDAFGYLSARYPAIVLHPVSGISHEEEPSLARLAELADFIGERRIGAIFTEPLVDPAFIQTLSEETGARVEVLDPIEGLVDDSEDANYLTQMEYNLQQLRSAIVCE